MHCGGINNSNEIPRILRFYVIGVGRVITHHPRVGHAHPHYTHEPVESISPSNYVVLLLVARFLVQHYLVFIFPRHLRRTSTPLSSPFLY